MLKMSSLRKFLVILTFLQLFQTCLMFSYIQNDEIGMTVEENHFIRSMKENLKKSKRQTSNLLQYNRTYQACNTPNGDPGHCKIVPLCDWTELKQNPSNYLDYFCVIEGSVVGVCCPDNLSSSQSTSNTTSRAGSSTIIPQSPECGRNSKSAQRIRTGQQSSAKDWPWMAVLLRRADYYNFCGGVLLNRRYVLTAAHCIFRKTANDFYVRLGEYNFTSPNETEYIDFIVTELRPHPDYDPATQRHDIALMKLNRPVQYNSYIKPVCLPYELPKTNVTVIVAGWGTLFYGGPVSDVLMEVPVPVWDINECASKYAQPIFNTNVCAAAYEGGKDSCQGDSGGPLLMQLGNGKWITIGIVSWGISCGEPGQPGVYTKVESYLSWIGTNIQDASP